MLPDLESLRCFEAGAAHLNFRVAGFPSLQHPLGLGHERGTFLGDVGSYAFGFELLSTSAKP